MSIIKTIKAAVKFVVEYEVLGNLWALTELLDYFNIGDHLANFWHFLDPVSLILSLYQSVDFHTFLVWLNRSINVVPYIL